MKKLVSVKKFSFSCIFILVAVFITMNLVQAGGKPVKWTAAVLNTSQNLQAYPLGKVYVGGEDGVSITNGIS